MGVVGWGIGMESGLMSFMKLVVLLIASAALWALIALFIWWLTH
jgi:hypothetical protein